MKCKLYSKKVNKYCCIYCFFLFSGQALLFRLHRSDQGNIFKIWRLGETLSSIGCGFICFFFVAEVALHCSSSFFVLLFLSLFSSPFSHLCIWNLSLLFMSHLLAMDNKSGGGFFHYLCSICVQRSFA